MNTDKPRIYYIDWLRVIAFGLLFLFHSIRIFDTYPWHLKNGTTDPGFNYIVEFMHSWRMYIIFFVSGAGTYFAMKSKKEKFLVGRVRRLIIPYLFGIAVLIPPQKYFEAVQQYAFDGGFLSFLRQLPATSFHVNFGWNLVWTGYLGYHIWYLAYLFILTILLLPFLRWIASRPNFPSLLSAKPGRSFGRFWLILIPFVSLEFLLRPVCPDYLDWADFATFTLYFLLGFISQVDGQWQSFIRRKTYTFLFIAMACWMSYVIWQPVMDRISVPSYSGRYFLILLLKNVNSIGWVMGLSGLAIRYANVNHRLLHDLNQGILPFYILHQTVIIAVGYYIIGLYIPVILKLLLVLILSFILSVLLYQLIWRNDVLRFLFGMKVREVKRVRPEQAYRGSRNDRP